MESEEEGRVKSPCVEVQNRREITYTLSWLFLKKKKKQKKLQYKVAGKGTFTRRTSFGEKRGLYIRAHQVGTLPRFFRKS